MSRPSLHQVVSAGLRKELKALSKKRGAKKAAVAYVTSDEDVAFGNRDILVCDASNAAIGAGQTDAAVLRRAFDRGAELFSLEGLHAKLVLCGRTAIIGSANLSGSALVEAALITTDHVIHAGIASLIDEIADHAKLIDELFLDRIEKIEVKRPSRRATSGKPRVRFADRGSRTWLINVTELPDDAFPEEAEVAAKGFDLAVRRRKNRRSDIDWIRFVGKTTFRTKAKAGDSVIQIWKRKGAKRVHVVSHSAILHVQKKTAWTRFFIESSPGRERLNLSWTDFEKLAKSCGLKNPSKRSLRVLDAEIAQEMARRWRKARRTKS